MHSSDSMTSTDHSRSNSASHSYRAETHRLPTTETMLESVIARAT